MADITIPLPDGSQFDKQDILALLNTGLKENQPFARYFAETTLREINRKLKDLKIQDTAIKIDGDQISDEINKGITEGVKKDIQSTNTVVRKALESARKSISSAKTEFKGFSIFGEDVSEAHGDKLKKIRGDVLAIFKTTRVPPWIKRGFVLDDLFMPSDNNNFRIETAKLSKEYLLNRRKILNLLIPFKGKGEPATASAASSPPPLAQPRKFTSVEEHNTEVDIGGFTPRALKDLSGLPGLHNISKLPATDENKKKDNSSLIRTLALAAAAFAGGSIATLISGFFDEGPFKGLKKMLGTAGLSLGVKVAKMLKTAVVNVSKFLLHEASSSASKIFKFLPGFKIGEFLSKGLSTLFGHVTGGIVKSFTAIFSGAKGVISHFIPKIGGKGIFALLKNALTNILGKGAKLLKFIPGLGTIISFGFAYSRFKSGDLVGGLLDMASGLAAIVPGIGTAIAIGIDIFSTIRDIKKTPEEKSAQGASLKGMASMVYSKIKPVLRYIPIIGAMIRGKEAYDYFKAGKIGKGLLSMVGSLSMIVPGIGMLVAGGVDWITSMVEDKPTVEPTVNAGGKIDIGQNIIKGLKHWYKKFYINSPSFMKWLLRKFSPDSWLEGLPLSELDAEEKAEYEKDQTARKQKGILAANSEYQTLVEEVKSLKNKEDSRSNQNRNNGMLAMSTGQYSSSDSMTPEERAKYWKKINTAESRITQLETEAAEKAKKQPADDGSVAKDFIWRKGQPIQKFEPYDNIVSVKSNEKFDKMMEAVSDKSSTDNMEHSINLMRGDFNLLTTKLQRTIESLVVAIGGLNNHKPVAVAENLPSISSDAGDVRDPAYVLRSRAWDRIRKGYVVI